MFITDTLAYLSSPRYMATGETNIPYFIGGALRPRLSGKLFWNVHSPDGHVGNAEAGMNIILNSDWL